MSGAWGLLSTVLPLALLAAVSPVIFLNSAAFVATGQQRSALGFLAGNAAVLVPIGAASAGIVGAALATQVHRDIASRTLDALLGVLLVGYGLLLLRRNSQEAAPGAAPQRSAFPFGILSMATNFTTLPLYLAATQRVGAVRPPGWAAVLLVAVVTAVTLTPAWAPIAAARWAPGALHRLTHRQRTEPARRWSVGRIVPIAACFLGGAFLLGHAVVGQGR